MDWLLGPSDTASDLDRPVGDDLVDVHVRLGARAGLPDTQRELIIELPGCHLFGRLDDQCRRGLVHLAEVTVDHGRGLLEHPKGVDQGVGHGVVGDGEVMEGSSRLGPPVALLGDLDRPHAVSFGPHAHRWISSISNAGSLRNVALRFSHRPQATSSPGIPSTSQQHSPGAALSSAGGASSAAALRADADVGLRPQQGSRSSRSPVAAGPHRRQPQAGRATTADPARERLLTRR